MFDNVGQSLKKLAVSMFVVGLIISLIVGIGLIMTFSAFTFLGLLLIPVVTFFSWVGALFIYGFGELICDTKEIALNTAKPQASQNSKADAGKTAPVAEKNNAKKAAPVAVKNNAVQVAPRKTLEDLYREGLITEEEYNSAIAKNGERKEK